jgi:hypothetical protein
MQVIVPARVQRRQLNGLAEDLLSLGSQFLQTSTGQQLAQQGVNYLRDQLKSSIKEIGVYTAYSKPVVYTGADIGKFLPDFTKPGQPPGKVTNTSGRKSIAERIKPTIVIDTSFGRQVIAPYGEAKPGEYKQNLRRLMLWGVGILTVYTAGAYYLGYKSGQRSRT